MEVAKRVPLEPGGRVRVVLSRAQRRLVGEYTLADPELIAIIDRGAATASGVSALLTLDEVEELTGHLYFEANHTTNSSLRAPDMAQSFLRRRSLEDEA